MAIRGVIFDLDGVIVSTDECHYQAWKKIAAEEGIYFDRAINARLRGVSRMESLEIILERAKHPYSEAEKLELAHQKNSYYREMIRELSPRNILPGVMNMLKGLKERKIKMAIGSSSKNCPLILERIGLDGFFDAVVDGNQISRTKPDPEVFLRAAGRLEIPPPECLVIEDADAGVEAALAGGMKVLGVGAAAANHAATFTSLDLAGVSVDTLLDV